MKIEQFIAQSEGEWQSMRSGHSLAFKQFESVISQIIIEILPIENKEVLNLLRLTPDNNLKPICPFRINWQSNSDWSESSDPDSSGSSICIPLPSSNTEGVMIRSLGYSERKESISSYSLTNENIHALEVYIPLDIKLLQFNKCNYSFIKILLFTI